MTDWNMWKEKAVNLTRAGVSKAKELGEIARLNLDNISEEEKIKQAYIQIGEKYCSLHENAPEAGYEEMFHSIAKAREAIQRNKARVADLKAEGNLSDEDLESIALENAPEKE